MDIRFIVFALALSLTAPAVSAQRHSERSSPPTAQFGAPAAPLAPIVPVSSGLGAIQFVQVNFGVPAPQSLTRQLRFDDDRTRAAALSAIGAPGQYMQHGHIPMPRSVNLELAPLDGTDELDALLTVELDQHLVTAVLIPVDGNWRRIATLIYTIPFEDAAASATTWVRTERSLVQKDRYRAVFHATTGPVSTGPAAGNFSENEAHLRIINNKAVITLSFESEARECMATISTGNTHNAIGPTKSTSRAAAGGDAAGTASTKSNCEITERWFQPDPADPTRRFQLVTASGRITGKELEEPLANTPAVLASHLRNFSCQPFVYSDPNQHYEPTAVNGPCRGK